MKELKILFLSGLLVFALSFACGDSGVSIIEVGKVEGTVTDSVTNLPISGVIVEIGNSAAKSAKNGVYSLKDIEIGSRTITASNTGYADYSGTVLVEKGTTVTHNIPMTPGGTSTGNTPPVANAGESIPVSLGTTVTLDGSASSDADGDSLTYTWSFTTKPAGSSATLLNANSANPNFQPDVEGAYFINLVVNDGKVNSLTAVVSITAYSSLSNNAPVADAGMDKSVSIGAIVFLDGSGSSDADSDILTYKWTIKSKPTGSNASLAGSASVNPSFLADAAGSFVFGLIVNDGKVNSTEDTVTITVTTSTNNTFSISGMVSGDVSSGVLILLTGTSSSSTTSGSGGDFSFTGLSNGAYTIVPTKTGYIFDPASINVTINGSDKIWQNFIASLVLKYINVGSFPSQVASTPDSQYIYLANSDDDTVSVIRTSDNQLVKTIDVGYSPGGVEVAKNGTYVYVTNWYDNSVSVIRTSDNTVVDTIAVGLNPFSLGITSDGKYVYVGNWYGNNVSVIRTSDNSVIKTITVGEGPNDIEISNDGAYVYVANYSSNNITKISTSTNSVVITLDNVAAPNDLAITADDKFLYITNPELDNMYLIEISTNTLIKTINLGDSPSSVEITPDGNYAYVANFLGDSVSTVRLSDNTVERTFDVGDGANDLTITPDGSLVYVTNSNDNTVCTFPAK